MSNKANARKGISSFKKELRKADIVKKQNRTKTLNKHNSNIYLVLLLFLNSYVT